MFKVVIIISLSLLAMSAKAANITPINRYVTVANKPLAAQINPLLAVQQVHFPPTVTTVGEAISWWLRYSGYTLADLAKQPSGLARVMQQPLPQINRHFGPLTVKDGLEVLVGQPVFTVHDDPFLREVRFHLKPAFQPSLTTITRRKA